MHDFAFRLRKLIELVSREKLPSKERALSQAVVCSPEGNEADAFDVESMSLNDICGRVIHSDVFEVRRARIPNADGTLNGGKAAWGFAVASDRDRNGSSRFVFIEFLLKEFVAFERDLGRDLRGYEAK